jgi:hypothetical protein
MVYPYSKFEYISNLIIDNLEGGYYHPDMYIKGAKNVNGGYMPPSAFKKEGADYGSSGETLYGLDRHAGWNNWYSSKRLTDSPQANLKYIYSGNYKFNSEDSKNFWTTLDKLDARNKWPWGYRGGNVQPQLKALCIKMMYPLFINNLWNKLDDRAKILILKDNKLAFNYIYGVWNGPYYYKYYTGIFNKQIKNGVTDSTSINNFILNARATSDSGLIRDSAKKIKKTFPKIKDTVTQVVPVEKKKTKTNLLLGGLVSILILLIIFRKKILK